MRLYNYIDKELPAANANVVSFNPILTAEVPFNSNLVPLCSTEQAKNAMYYLSPYLGKSKLKLAECLAIFHHVAILARDYPSDHGDFPEELRYFKSVLNKAHNFMNRILVEMSDTQAALSLLGTDMELNTTSYVYLDPWERLRYMEEQLEAVILEASDDDTMSSYDEFDDGDFIASDDDGEQGDLSSGMSSGLSSSGNDVSTPDMSLCGDIFEDNSSDVSEADGVFSSCESNV